MSDDVGQWLGRQGFGAYAAAFAENKIDAEILASLTSDDLREMGIAAIGDRRKLLAAIAARTDGGDAEGKSKSPAPSAEAERRILTVMFCDMVGSTALSQRLDPEDLREIMGHYQDTVAGAVTRHGGHVAKYLGDGVLAYFGWPRAHEDQAGNAVRAGLDAVVAVGRLTGEDGHALAARVGIATGQVVVGDLIGEDGRDNEAVVGETPNLAARLQAAAKPGHVVIGAATRRLVGNAFNLEALGQQDLKGFVGGVSLWRAIGERPTDSRFDASHGELLTPFVGREHELALLLDRWEMAQGGNGQVVALSGEAGIGKSRVVRALQEEIADKPHFQLRYQCSPQHTNSAFYPIIHRLERAAGFVSNDDNESRLDKLEDLLRLAVQDIATVGPIFSALLSLKGEARYGSFDMTAQQRRERTIEALADQVRTLALQRPVLFVLEDAHWIDPSTRELLDHIARNITDAAVLILTTYRHEATAPISSAVPTTTVTLNRLSHAQGAEIIQAAGGDSLPKDVMDRIVARTDGVPLYVEELTRLVAEAGQEASTADIPETLQASLMARLDRLGEAKELVQIGAVIGREFGHSLLAAVTGRSEQELATLLETVVHSDLVFRRATPPDAVYTFKHALVQDAAYQSLLRRTRQTYHQQVAEVFERRFPETAASQPELVAHHYAEAALPGRSIEFWYKAGEQAIHRSANPEAIAHLTRGRAYLADEPHAQERDSKELAFCLALGPALMSTKGLASPEAEQVYLRARELCRTGQHSAQSFSATWGLWLVNQQRGELNEAQRLTDEVLSIANQQQDNTHQLLQAHHAAWTTQLFAGNIAASHRHVVEGGALYEMDKHRNHAFIYGGHDPGVCAKTTASEALSLLGYVAQAVDSASAAVTQAERLAHPFSLAMARYFMGQVHQYRNEPALVERHAREAVIMCEEHGFESFRAQSSVLLGWAIAAQGDRADGIPRIRDGLDAWAATGTGMRRPYFLALLADALLAAGSIDDGLAAVDEAEALIESSGECRWQAETLRLKGMLRLEHGANADAVATHFRDAIAVARRQESKLLELRAATSLARLTLDHAKPEDARDLLAPVLDWFTEGFDAPDLRAAKAFLDGLR